jgi:hypothetical protein
LIDRVMKLPEIFDRPPVLLDIGAAGEIHPKWRPIARYSVCIAFDADERGLDGVREETGRYRKLHIYNRVAVDDRSKNEVEFHLTRLPTCSSTLRPRAESLSRWAFADYFEVERSVRLRAVRITEVLDELGIGKIDWFKTDSQGTDLRLFRGLGEERIRRVLAAEFEPGILDAYEGEDKLWAVLSFMEGYPFWVSDIVLGGTQRLDPGIIRGRLSARQRRYLPRVLRLSPGWAGIAFLNRFDDEDRVLEKRDYLLGWVFAMLERQPGFAIEVARGGEERYGDPFFRELEEHAFSKLMGELRKWPRMMIRDRLAGIRRKIFPGAG